MTSSKRDMAALVTGAGRRIGAGIATALAADGWYVHIHCRQSRDEAERLLAKIREADGDGAVVAADLADAGAVERLYRTCSEGPVPLGCVVNNASLFGKDDVQDFTVADWDRHQAVNLRAPVLLARQFAAELPEGAEGCVVNLIDNKVFALNPDYFSYTISKFGLLGATETLAMALAPKVRVCGIAPGITLVSGAQTEAGFERAHRMNPLGRGCDVDDIVRAVRFILATPSITGQVITLDGGQSLAQLPRDVAYL